MSRAREEPVRAAVRRFQRRFVRDLRRLVDPHDTILVAVSGGIDSVVLLHLLRFGHDLPPIRLHAAHFDHRMRAGSMHDAAWVRGLAAAWQVPLTVGETPLPLRAEAAARAARYAFLLAAADATGATRIATAHHADDQAETVLFRMIRGTGLGGLSGIPPRRGPFIRPLLAFRRAEIERYARDCAIAWRVDPTNAQPIHTRNRIRLHVLPALEAIRPGATAALTRLAADARAAERAWRPIVDRAFQDVVRTTPDASLELARDRLLAYHPHVRARVLRRALRRFGSVPGRSGTHAALEFTTAGASGGMIELAGGVQLLRSFDRLVIRRTGAPPAPDRPVRIDEPGTGRAVATIGGRALTIDWSCAAREPAAPAASFDPAALRFPLELRAWRPGDRVVFAYGSKKLKKLFAERRIARDDRARTPVLADADGRVLWVVGVTRAAGAEPAEGGPVFQITVANGERS
jgi:tRNA(Ile)-lysidine synthase